MATQSRAKRKAEKRQTSVKAAEAGVKSAQDVFKKILEKADPDSVKKKVVKDH